MSDSYEFKQVTLLLYEDERCFAVVRSFLQNFDLEFPFSKLASATPPTSMSDSFENVHVFLPSRKHAYIMLTSLNPTFI